MYRSLADAVLVRAAVFTPDQVVAWPDLIEGTPAQWVSWLATVMDIPGFAAALQYASPALTSRVAAVRAGQVSDRDVRRVVLVVMRYLLRATTRATPNGLFAGVAAAVSGDTAAQVGAGHRPVARIRTSWLDAVVGRLEADPHIRPYVRVRANDLLAERDGYLLLEHRSGGAADGAPVHLRVCATPVVAAALAAAARPILYSDLATTVARTTNAPPAAVDRLLAQLVEQRLILTELRPSATCTDPLTYLLPVLDRILAVDASTSAAMVELVNVLRRIAERKQDHDHSSGNEAAAYRRELTTTAAGVVGDVPAIGVDLHLDCAVAVPASVTAEASAAAAVLTRLSVPAPIGWAGWHRRFLERFGPYALVPVLDAVDPVLGLGYPAGFAGAAPAPPALITDRDRALLAAAQRATLARQQEIVLDEPTIAAWNGTDQPQQIQATTELTVRVHADNLESIRDGRFDLSIVRVSRNAGTSTGRVLDLLGPGDQHRIGAAYASNTTPVTDGALIAQLAAPTRYAISMDVARSPQVMPYLISLGEFHDDTGQHRIPVDDIAVTADPQRLYLICISRRRPVQPVPLTAVDPDRQMMPISRFLAEASTALAAPCHPFDWGPAARDLPFLPAVRHGRTILSAARWRLTTDDLPKPTATWPAWTASLHQWRTTTGCPSRVAVGSGDQRLAIDLDEPAHQALLRDYLDRHQIAVLFEAPPAAGWLGQRAHEIVIPLASTASPVPVPRISGEVVRVRDHGSLPGGHRTLLKVYADRVAQDRVLTDYLPDLLAQMPGPWWFQRYYDPDAHLRLRLGRPDPILLHTWTRRLRENGLTSRTQLDTDYPETARFGGSTTYDAAEALFAADSAAVLAQLACSRHRNGPPRQALTAASILDLTTSLLGDVGEARRWLIDHIDTQRIAPDRTLYRQAIDLSGPAREALAAAPSGTEVLAAWQQRADSLTRYRNALHAACMDSTLLLPDLLHLHHTRVEGPDRAAEAVCLHLARAAALSWTARARTTP